MPESVFEQKFVPGHIVQFEDEKVFLLEYEPNFKKATDKKDFCAKVYYETLFPSASPTTPISRPSNAPTNPTTPGPSEAPLNSPSSSPTDDPTYLPSESYSSSPSDDPTDLPSLSPSPKGRCITLQEALIKDNMPQSSSKCVSPNGATESSFIFESSQAESEWFEGFPGSSEKYGSPWFNLEPYVFNARMVHQDPSVNRTWTMRLGTGGNIYSLVGPMGETVSPQRRDDSPWIDEVWHSVCSDPLKNQQKHFMIHGAGSYQYDASYGQDTGIPVRERPFYSPSLGKYCHDEDGECGFAAWPQHGPIPTGWESTVINFNRYKNCGNGVIEYTSVHHNNMGNDFWPARIDNPLASIRFSNLRDVVVTDKKDGEEIIEPHELGRYDLDVAFKKKATDTLGYITFAQDLPSKNTGKYPLKDGVNIVIHPLGCRNGPPDLWGYKILVVMCRIEPTVEDNTSTRAALTFRGTPKPVSLPNVVFKFKTYGSGAYCRPFGSDVMCRLDESSMNNYKNGEGNANIIKFTSVYGATFTLTNGVKNWAIEFNGIYSLIYKPGPDSSASTVNSVITGDPLAYTLSAERPPGAGGDVHAKNGTPQLILHIKDTGAWWMYFKPDPIPGVSDLGAYMNNKFIPGSTIEVLWNTGMPTDHNTALTHVYGNEFSRVRGLTEGWPLVWVGNANEGTKPRDLNVYSLVTTANDNYEGGSHYYRQYIIIDNFVGMSEKAQSWVDEVITDNYTVKKDWHSTPVGQTIDLIVSNGKTIVAKIGTNEESATQKVCSGSTTPNVNSKALFEVVCGDASYIGSDPYHFAPNLQSGDKKPYICSNDNTVRGTWTLLGFFPDSACAQIETGYTFDQTECI
eukprot:CAMPEP_0113328226 /NCGR_PEP_ID=MMETSP0010_2-20120614/19873_1 /TAXON_ID=216773 ORGANISM="Corethron hystrix, Strain 308" /NCGR_SAMPLE_ID=MMETSP0010_2 /ASSEMBLY_ACC=CAM_ASM_000155 /LENGTH=852 /DNA_ID=CAMNT_0000189473 /DNA_START=133 /DNA_END=2692 /DNA_ORIENTATION=+ /assembly_acc=CAM_ASM_000155